ncbi:MAG TPA: hypothetical protein VFV01_18740 [Spirillospora sp.]|nr:hypothetical protein [Spirillospora sp.]
MFGRRRWARLEKTLDEVGGRLDQVERHQDNIRTILTVQNPGSQVAADAYDGLRKQVVSAMAERLAHLTQLVQLDAALAQQASPDVLGKLVRGWLEQSNLVKVADLDHPDADVIFEVVAADGGEPALLSPAYLDGISGRVIRQGRVRCAASGRPERHGRKDGK